MPIEKLTTLEKKAKYRVGDKVIVSPAAYRDLTPSGILEFENSGKKELIGVYTGISRGMALVNFSPYFCSFMHNGVVGTNIIHYTYLTRLPKEGRFTKLEKLIDKYERVLA